MGFIKCPRCELNYIREEEQFCSVCRREMLGERQEDPFELCSVCGENPVMPGKDVCYTCYKEMTQQHKADADESEGSGREELEIGMDDVSEMDEVELDDMGDEVPEEIGTQISLEEERRKEDKPLEEEQEDEG